MELASPFIATMRLIGFVVLLLLVAPVQLVLRLFRLKAAQTFPQQVLRWGLWLVGIRTVRRGRSTQDRPTIWVANNLSYLDILILICQIDARFVVPADVKTWPIIGWLTRLYDTSYLRADPRQAVEQTKYLQQFLQDGQSLVIFPEGKIGDGQKVWPFKTAFFGIADTKVDGRYVTVQPISVTYTKLDGIAMGRSLRSLYAWYGDIPLLSHLWRAISLGIVTVVVEFHPKASLANFANRKQLAAFCQAEIEDGMSEALAGRPQRREQFKSRSQPGISEYVP